MFKILIVEDDSEKLRTILNTLDEIKGIDTDKVEHCVDALSAKKMLEQNHYDLLILDVAIPNRKSEAISLNGGIDLLKEITTRENYKIPSHIIGLTARDEIFEQATKEFGSQIISVIKYSNTDIAWQNHLRSGVENFVLSKSFSNEKTKYYDYDIAIINAVDVEFAAVKALSSDWKRVVVPNDSTLYFETVFSRGTKNFRVIISCASQMGMTASAVLSMKVIENFRPRYLFMTGIAASVKSEDAHGYGDIIVVDECWDGGAGKIIQDDSGHSQFEPTALHLRLDVDIADKMRILKDNTALLRSIKDNWKPNKVPNTELTIHIGSMASVAGVIANPAVSAELKVKDRKLLALEMEVYGMYFAATNCSKPKPLAIAIKSVADFANQNKEDLYQNYASYTSSRIMYEFILNELENSV